MCTVDDIIQRRSLNLMFGEDGGEMENLVRNAKLVIVSKIGL